MLRPNDWGNLDLVDDIAARELAAHLDTPRRVAEQGGPAGNDASCDEQVMTAVRAEADARHARASNRLGDAPAVASLSFRGLVRAVHRRRTLAIGEAIRDAIALGLRAAASLVRRGALAYRRHRQASETRYLLAGLDDYVLRDLGLDRSEIGSVAAESSGESPLTRMRVLVGMQWPM